MTVPLRSSSGLSVLGPMGPEHQAVLTPEALDFLGRVCAFLNQPKAATTGS